MAVTFAPFGTYATMTNATSAAAKTELDALIVVFLNLLPSKVGGVNSNEISSASPEFVDINQHYIEKIEAELKALRLAISAGA